MKRIMNFFKDESGVSAVEYALLVAVVAVLLLVGVSNFYSTLNGVFNDNATKIQDFS